MACKSCINRQKFFVRLMCERRPDSALCKKAQARLEKMEAQK